MRPYYRCQWHHCMSNVSVTHTTHVSVTLLHANCVSGTHHMCVSDTLHAQLNVSVLCDTLTCVWTATDEVKLLHYFSLPLSPPPSLALSISLFLSLFLFLSLSLSRSLSLSLSLALYLQPGTSPPITCIRRQSILTKNSSPNEKHKLG